MVYKALDMSANVWPWVMATQVYQVLATASRNWGRALLNVGLKIAIAGAATMQGKAKSDSPPANNPEHVIPIAIKKMGSLKIPRKSFTGNVCDGFLSRSRLSSEPRSKAAARDIF